MKQSAPPLQLRQLTKQFGLHRGIENVSLSLEKGEVFGFLGPNGAGKTTTMRLIMDFLLPTSGDVMILGASTLQQRRIVHNRVGYLPGEVKLYEDMTGEALLSYLSRLGLSVDWQYVEELGRRLEASLDRPIRTLSKGNRQKIGLLQAFMHQPELLILDEPTSGLDPLMKQVFYQMVREAASRGSTIIMSSHDLAEVQKVCHRAGFIREGKLIAIEPVDAAMPLTVHRYWVTFAKKPDIGLLQSLPSVERVERSAEGYTFTVRGSVGEFVVGIGQYEPTALRETEVELEEVFLQYYQRQGAGQ